MSPTDPSAARPAGEGSPPAWVEELRAVDGLRVWPGEPLARHSTLRIGGPAEVWATIGSEAALRAALRILRRAGRPLAVIGLGSNLLFPDEGLEGMVARLGEEFRALEVDGTQVVAGAALPLALAARRTAERGLVGLEALAGFPSTVGGATYMNAGCYGTEMKDLLVSAVALDEEGERVELTPRDLEPDYRHTALHGRRLIVTRVVLELARGDAEDALARLDELNRRRWSSLPSGVANAGSIFKNPPEDFAGRLIEACGLKGRRHGGAQISPKHANVIVNRGDASALDVVELMAEAHRAVRERFGVELEPELILVGPLAGRFVEAVAPPPA